MNTFTKYARKLRTTVLLGAIALATLTASAQQEVAPDHFDGSEATAQPQKARPAKVRKVAAHKSARVANTTAKNRKSSGSDAAGK